MVFLTSLATTVILSAQVASASSARDEHGFSSHAWNECLPGPLVHPEHPACPTAFSEDNNDPNTPWTHPPSCTGSDANYCVFTNAAFPRTRGRHGISIISLHPNATTSPSPISSIEESFLISSSQHHHIAEPDSDPPYEVRDIHSKGKGLVATRLIPRGSVLMVEHAAIVADALFPISVRRDQGRLLLQEAIARLPNPDEILGLATSSKNPNAGVPAAEDVLKTNSFTVTVAGRSHFALFPRIARINHACDPSALTKFDGKTLTNTVLAFRDIKPGEEISISYADFGLTSQERQRTLLQKWGFKCTCSLCSAHPAEIAASDARRLEIKELGEQVLQHVEKSDFSKAVEVNEKLWNAVSAEKLVSHMGDHFEVMARLCLAAGDRKGAKEYARRALAELNGFYHGAEAEWASVGELEELVAKL
ncbi:hypothetical protein B0H63DRAFT_540625 [Podospora didyma]|uniref:SET domain-containing protein n=1 Tax=Podospora didyma TaxID=330526 RepID=A0AAE0NSD6_9PEZI|nr:hypothetical protein B0H63DRAFT_540625 [Podospora didyma]